MKKLILLALLAVIMASCSGNLSGKRQTYFVIKKNGDTLSIKADDWKWQGKIGNVLFTSYYGDQYVSDVKDITLKEEGYENKDSNIY